MVDLSIIIVSFNTKELTKNCIESIIENTKNISYEIIVVDNGSSDGSVEYLNSTGSERSRPFTTIFNKTNLGYAKANNQGIKIAKGKAILLLNSDTIIQKNSIDEAYEHLEKADILTVNLKNEDMTNQQAAGYGPNLFNIFCWAFFIDDLPFINRIIRPYQISDKSFFEKSHEVDWVMGAFFMMKRQVVERIGDLDEKIFMYGEEMEFCRRAKNEHFKVMYFDFPFIIHLGQGSSESSEGAVLGEYKAVKYFFSKYYSAFVCRVVKIILFFSVLFRWFAFMFINKKRSEIYAKAFKVI